MLVIEINIKLHNLVKIDNSTYFLFMSKLKPFLITLVGCPHKGGPLYLGCFNSENESIICPWHRKKISYGYMATRSLPAVKKGDSIFVYVDKEISTSVHLCKKYNTVNND